MTGSPAHRDLEYLSAVPCIAHSGTPGAMYPWLKD